MRDSHEEFLRRGVRIVAISVDPPAVTKEHAAKQSYPFLFLADETMEVIRAWDFLHEGGRATGADISRPAEFLIDSSGVIRWRNLTDNYRERLTAEEALRAIDEAKAAAPAASTGQER